jgi:DNA-binding NtrC family response regulator
MDERTQINLLRVLETRSYARVGGKKERDSHVRVLAASDDGQLTVNKTSG